MVIRRRRPGKGRCARASAIARILYRRRVRRISSPPWRGLPRFPRARGPGGVDPRTNVRGDGAPRGASNRSALGEARAPLAIKRAVCASLTAVGARPAALHRGDFSPRRRSFRAGQEGKPRGFPYPAGFRPPSPCGLRLGKRSLAGFTSCVTAMPISSSSGVSVFLSLHPAALAGAPRHEAD